MSESAGIAIKVSETLNGGSPMSPLLGLLAEMFEMSTVSVRKTWPILGLAARLCTILRSS